MGMKLGIGCTHTHTHTHTHTRWTPTSSNVQYLCFFSIITSSCSTRYTNTKLQSRYLLMTARMSGLGCTHFANNTGSQRTTQTPFYIDPGTSKPIFVIYSVYGITQYNKWCTCGAWDDSHMSKPAELKNKIVLHWSSRWRNNTLSILNFSMSSGPSLVQSSAPVFDRILYAKMKGEGLGERVTCVMSGRREGRCEGGGTWRRILQSFLWYFVQELETVTFKRQW